MKILNYFIFLILFSSCNKLFEEKPKHIDEIQTILNSDKSLEKKYEEIYDTGLINWPEITMTEKIEIGKNFFQIFPQNAGIKILQNGKLVLHLKGTIQPNFNNIVFDNYTFKVLTKIKIGKKYFTSGQLIDATNFNSSVISYDLNVKLLNDIEAAYGNEEFIWLDESYLKYNPISCVYNLEITAKNQVGEMCQVFLLDEDFKEFWTQNPIIKYYR